MLGCGADASWVQDRMQLGQPCLGGLWKAAVQAAERATGCAVCTLASPTVAARASAADAMRSTCCRAPRLTRPPTPPTIHHPPPLASAGRVLQAAEREPAQGAAGARGCGAGARPGPPPLPVSLWFPVERPWARDCLVLVLPPAVAARGLRAAGRAPPHAAPLPDRAQSTAAACCACAAQPLLHCPCTGTCAARISDDAARGVLRAGGAEQGPGAVPRPAHRPAGPGASPPRRLPAAAGGLPRLERPTRVPPLWRRALCRSTPTPLPPRSCQSPVPLTRAHLHAACVPQALHKLQEPRALVRCRAADKQLVEGAIADAKVRCCSWLWGAC